MTASLSEFVSRFAEALTVADNRRPVAVSPRSGRIYQPGIGPHPEDRAVDLIVAELKVLRPNWRIALQQCYPGSKQTCDLLWGDPAEWAIEIKMFRPNGDNGKPDDRSHRTSAAAHNSRAASLSLRRVSWSIVGRWTAGAGDAPSPSETDEVTNVGA